MPRPSPQTVSPLRVLHVITPSRMAGAETFLARLLKRAGGGGVDHHCVLRSSLADGQLEAAGVTFDKLRIGGKLNLLALPRLHRAARRHEAKLLHSHLSTASWWCGWYEQLGGPPSIGHVHGFTSATWHRRQSHLIACSDAVRRHLLREGISDERITVLHYPVDADDMRPQRSSADVRAELGAAPNTPIVGTFAHLSRKKGYRELVQAAALVLRHMPAAQFWCFGEGPLRAELEQSARKLGIADRFKLFGFRRDVPDLMQTIDVMCLPSHREPFGLVYVEAALAEKPVIACQAGGAPEIVANGETGLLVPPPKAANKTEKLSGTFSVEPLADAVLALLENRGQAAAMGRRGRELALDRFGWPTYLARLNEIYDRTLSRQTHPLPTAAPPRASRVALVAHPWRPQMVLALGLLIMSIAGLVGPGPGGWGNAPDATTVGTMQQLPQHIHYEVYTDRAAFERRLHGAMRWVDFDDIDTGGPQFAAFEPARYASRGIIIRGAMLEQPAGGGRTADSHAIGATPLSLHAPVPAGAIPAGNRTDVEFVSAGRPALVCGFGLNLVDLDSRDDDRSSITLVGQDGGVLFTTDDDSDTNAGAAFRGIVAVDATGKPVPVIAQVRLIHGAVQPEPAAEDHVALDNFVYAVPRPYRR